MTTLAECLRGAMLLKSSLRTGLIPTWNVEYDGVAVKVTGVTAQGPCAEIRHSARRGVSLSELFRMSAPTEADVPGWYRRVEAGLPGTSPGLPDA